MIAAGLNIGLCGAHRTGKTTLAEAVSARAGLPFVRTATTEIMREFGVDPSRPMDFATRLKVQRRILEVYEETFAGQAGAFITDRTPIDLMMYTLADVSGSTPVDHPDLERYVGRCFEVTNRTFGMLFVLQPGIPLVAADGKAPLNTSYIEHLNSLVLGLCHDERNTAHVTVIGRPVTGLERRAGMILEKWCWASAETGSPEEQIGGGRFAGSRREGTTRS